MACARVSTKEETEKGSSIPAQLKAIREYADSHGSRILEECMFLVKRKRIALYLCPQEQTIIVVVSKKESLVEGQPQKTLEKKVLRDNSVHR